MLTSFLSALCAVVLGTSSAPVQADTTNVYIINGKKVENFDGSQLVGMTVSDYRTGISRSESNGKVSTTKMHIIRTDGRQAASVTSMTTTSDAGVISIVGSDVDSSNDVSISLSSDGLVTVIDGKKSSSEELKKIKPEKIASMTVYKAGSKEAMEWTKNKNNAVIYITLKK